MTSREQLLALAATCDDNALMWARLAIKAHPSFISAESCEDLDVMVAWHNRATALRALASEQPA